VGDTEGNLSTRWKIWQRTPERAEVIWVTQSKLLQSFPVLRDQLVTNILELSKSSSNQKFQRKNQNDYKDTIIISLM
jgi:hypothetical protein